MNPEEGKSRPGKRKKEKKEGMKLFFLAEALPISLLFWTFFIFSAPREPTRSSILSGLGGQKSSCIKDFERVGKGKGLLGFPRKERAMAEDKFKRVEKREGVSYIEVGVQVD